MDIETPLTFQELILGLPFQECEILGGWMGKERSFTFVQTELSPVRKQTLLLLPALPETMVQLPDFMRQDELQGAVFYGEKEIYVPSSLAKELDPHKPFLFVKASDESILLRSLRELALLKSQGLFHYIWEQVPTMWFRRLHEEGISGVLRRLMQWSGQPAYLLDLSFMVHPVMGGECSEVDSFSFLKAKVQRNKTHDPYMEIQDGESGYMLFSIEDSYHRLGWLLLQKRQGVINHIDIRQIQCALSAIATGMQQHEEILENERKHKQQFLYDVLYNNFESEELIINQGKLWGWDFTCPMQLLVVQKSPGEDYNASKAFDQGLERTIQALMVARNEDTQPIVASILEQNVILLPATGKNSLKRKDEIKRLAQDLVGKLAALFPEMDIRIGIGRFYPSNKELFRSFQEAKIALELGQYAADGKTISLFEEIGVMRLLAQLPNDVLLDFYHEHLAEMIAYDRENDGVLGKTLWMFLRENGDIGRTADALYIHPNTLRNRLKKIESLLDVNLNSYEDLLNIFTSLKISQLLK